MEPADAAGHPRRGLNVGERDWLAERFEENRNHLRAVAYRMLGSLSEADDAVQETWLRLSRSETNEVENLGGWLTTVIARVCLEHVALAQGASRGLSGGEARGTTCHERGWKRS